MTNTIAIVGGGPVGLAFALAASALPQSRVLVLERAPFPTNAESAPAEAPFDHRVYALSPRSMQFLAALGVADFLPSARLAPIRQMRVFGDAAPSSPLPALALQAPVPLATVVEHRALMQALQRCVLAAQARGTLELRSDITVRDIAPQGGGYRLTLTSSRDDYEHIECALLVGADGRASRVRTALGIEVVEHDYESHAVVANFTCEKSHAGNAYQWFAPRGVLAYLPLPQQAMSVVWSVPRADAEELMQLSEQEFSARVREAGHAQLGGLQLISPRAAVPLKRVFAREWIKTGAVLMGDSAHAVHPLAGQGMNLGFGDAEALARILRDRKRLQGIGDVALLRRYSRERIEPAMAMTAATDRLQWLFASEFTSAKWLRRGGLTAVDRLGAVKGALVEYALQS